MKHNVNYYKFIFIINWQDFALEIYFASVFYGLCYLKLYKNSLQKISRLTLKRTYFTDEIAACYCSSMYSLRSLTFVYGKKISYMYVFQRGLG